MYIEFSAKIFFVIGWQTANGLFHQNGVEDEITDKNPQI